MECVVNVDWPASTLTGLSVSERPNKALQLTIGLAGLRAGGTCFGGSVRYIHSFTARRPFAAEL